MTPDHDPQPDNGSELGALEQRLHASRPVPSAGFRGDLGRLLIAKGTDAPPRRLRLMIAAYAGSGAMLLLAAAAGVAGAGPLSA